MAALLLVHGSCHGAWCWREVIPALEALGHAARAIDLPAHGEDRTPAAAATLDGYAGAILAAIGAPVTLVAHSAAGYPATPDARPAPSAGSSTSAPMSPRQDCLWSTCAGRGRASRSGA